MGQIRPSIICKACGGSADYDFDKGAYRCKSCIEARRSPAANNEVVTVVEVPLGELERRLEVGVTSPRSGWNQAQREIRRNEYRRALEDAKIQGGVESDARIDAMSGRVEFGEPVGKSVMLPLYIFSASTLWGRAQIAVNGETGKVASKVPYSWFKVAPTLILGILLLAGVTVATGGIGLVFLVILVAWAEWAERKKKKQIEATFLEAGPVHRDG